MYTGMMSRNGIGKEEMSKIHHSLLSVSTCPATYMTTESLFFPVLVAPSPVHQQLSHTVPDWNTTKAFS
jgi:hypothetical protein